MRDGLLLLASVSLISSLYLAPAASARTTESAQSKTCSAEATRQRLTGAKRASFRATCLRGSLTPKRPTASETKAPAVKAVVAPSGADRTSRSTACNAEAGKRGLSDSAFQSFRKACLASAAPVNAIETAQTPTKPTKAKPKIEGLTNTPPH